MRRILIDKAVHDRAEEFANVMTVKKPALIGWHNDKMPKRNLARFIRYLLSVGEKELARYVIRIYVMYKEILTMPSDKFEKFHEDNLKDWDAKIGRKISYDGNEKKFYEHVQDCMRYTSIRSGLLRYYMQQQMVKCCVYCNAQYAVTTDEFIDEDGTTKRIGTYQFDHFYPESKYPYLCTSFFNLQPSCPTCNDSKNKRDAKFNLYTTKAENIEAFRFDLHPAKKLEEYTKDDMSSLYVELNSDDADLLSNHLQLFHINQIYAQHTDVLQRLIVILKNNRPSYTQALTEGLEELFPNGVEDPEYFFFGYYMKPEHIHYQPLSKMVQDVVNVLR